MASLEEILPGVATPGELPGKIVVFQVFHYFQANVLISVG